MDVYFPIDMMKEDKHKTTFMLSQGTYVFRKRVLGNPLSSKIWLKASNEEIKGLPVIFKLEDNLLVGGKTMSNWRRGWRLC